MATFAGSTEKQNEKELRGGRKETDMACKTRTKEMTFFVTEEEKNQIKNKGKELGFPSASDYLRNAAINPNMTKVDTSGLHELAKQVAAIGRNINQFVIYLHENEEMPLKYLESVLTHQRNAEDKVGEAYGIIEKLRDETKG